MDVIGASSTRLHEGEIEAMTLAEQQHLRLLMDESLGRRVAESRGIEVTGLLGILLLTKERNPTFRVAPVVSALRDDGFRMSPELMDRVLRLAGDA